VARVIARLKEDLRGGLRRVTIAEYRHRDRRAFVAWDNPHSGKSIHRLPPR
jgi:hypothetical protein